MSKLPFIAPSILSADFAYLHRDISLINQSDADWFHIDIMDGQFVPNISFGLPVLQAISRYAQKPLDVHIMMLHPERYITAFRDAGAHHLTLHIETLTHADATLHQIQKAGMKVGLALNPSTPIEMIQHIIHLCDMVCIMSVNPGFGGQKFIPYTLEKIKYLHEIITKNNLNTLIEVDGGVTLDNAVDILQAGADVLVAGNTVFSTDNPTAIIKKLKSLKA